MQCGTDTKTISDILEETAAAEWDRMLDRLMKERGIEAGDYKSLAADLVINPIRRGFRRPHFVLEYGDYGAVIHRKDRGGRPAKWTQEKLDQLINDIKDAKKKHHLGTDTEAVRYITSSYPADRDPAKLRKTLKNILGAERRARRDAALLFRRARKLMAIS